MHNIKSTHYISTPAQYFACTHLRARHCRGFWRGQLHIDRYRLQKQTQIVGKYLRKCAKQCNQHTHNPHLYISINSRHRSCNTCRISFEIRIRRSFFPASHELGANSAPHSGLLLSYSYFLQVLVEHFVHRFALRHPADAQQRQRCGHSRSGTLMTTNMNHFMCYASSSKALLLAIMLVGCNAANYGHSTCGAGEESCPAQMQTCCGDSFRSHSIADAHTHA